jgi:hypothetical protein
MKDLDNQVGPKKRNTEVMEGLARYRQIFSFQFRPRIGLEMQRAIFHKSKNL